MGWKAGMKLLESDLLVGLRHWYSSIANRDADIGVPVAGTKAIIGSGGSMAEYVHNGTAWSLRSQPRAGYVPVWNGVSALGNGVSSGDYRISDGVVQVRAQFTVGSTTTFTAGTPFYPSLPDLGAGGPTDAIPGYVFDASAGAWQTVLFVPGNYLLTPTGGRLTSTNPYPLATGDVIRVSGAVMLP